MKRIGSSTWVHKSSEDELPRQPLSRAKRHLGDSNYAVVKYNSDSGDFTFIQSPNFDSASEPTVGRQTLVRKDGSMRVMPQKEDPQIYHRKELFVKPDYKGFSVVTAKKRSERIDKLNVDKSRIGTLSYWKENVIPKLKENKMSKAAEFLAEMNENRAVIKVSDKDSDKARDLLDDLDFSMSRRDQTQFIFDDDLGKDVAKAKVLLKKAGIKFRVNPIGGDW